MPMFVNCCIFLHFLKYSYISLHANLIPADAYLTPIVGYRGSICVLMMSTFRGYFSDRSELPNKPSSSHLF